MNIEELERDLFGKIRLYMISSPPAFFGSVVVTLMALIFVLVFVGMAIRLCQLGCPKCGKRGYAKIQDRGVRFGLTPLFTRDENELMPPLPPRSYLKTAAPQNEVSKTEAIVEQIV